MVWENARILRAISISLLWVAISTAKGFAGDETKKKLSADEARKVAGARLRTIALAFHEHHNTYREFPPAALVRNDGKPLLSWRVLLLPRLGQTNLFNEFKLGEPWDSPHNKKLLAKMPEVYRSAHAESAPADHTPWQVFSGPGTIFDGEKAGRIRDITDGTSNTILVAESARPVPWTKPEDLPYDLKQPVPKLGLSFPGAFAFTMADGSMHFGRRDAPETALRSAITRNDGEAFAVMEILAEQPGR